MPSLEAPPRLAAQQVAFAAHLRDPAANPPPPGIENRRMAIYRELFYNTVEGLLATGFPVLRRLRDDAAWHALVRDFYREHASHTPLFPEVGREFLRYLETRQRQGRGDPEFLLELAHYEWVELALSLDDSELDAIDCAAAADLLDGVPLLSPLAWPLAYRYPVQLIRPEFQPDTPPAEPTLLLIVRGRDDTVRFKALDPLAYHLIQAIGDNDAGRSGRELLTTLAAAAQVDDPAAFIASGANLLEQLRQREVILGARPAPTQRTAAWNA